MYKTLSREEIMRTARFFIGLLVLVIAAVYFTPLLPVQAVPAIQTSAQGAALIDVQSGRILYSHDGDKPMRIASLTKVMTAIVAIEHGKLSDIAKVSKNAFGKEGSSIYLKLGEEMSLHHLLYGMMLRSGNDAATAIAEHVGGSEEGFVYLMNEQAKLLGMKNTLFKNPHGLDADGHLSTANDMAKLTAYALKNPVFQDIVKTKLKKVPNPHEEWDYTWHNKNKLLSMYEGADGVKTGYTKSAGRCLITSATRNGQQLAVVTLNDRNDWVDHARLFNYGFEHFPAKEWVKKGDPIEGTNYVAGQSFVYPTAQNEDSLITRKAVVHPNSELTSRLGHKGSLDIYLNSTRIGTIPLYESGSPLLRTSNQTAFSYRSDSDSSAYRSSSFLDAIHTVVRMLFLADSHSKS
jgi:serine-type D-Ala-D-Ala carboxypeptidase (penicillin-binding protein 5/6)